MDKNGRAYEPPKTKIYRFNEHDKVLTASGDPAAEYAANALNRYMEGTNTTIE